MPAHMLVKPRKGTAAKAKRARRAAIERAERKAKDGAKRRDYWACRRCLVRPDWLGALGLRLEAAHIRDKGLGGDHGLRSSTPADYVTLCSACHQGPRSVHSGHIRIVAGPDGGDGVVEFVDVANPGAA